MGQPTALTTLASGKQLFVDVQPGPGPHAPTLIFLHGLGSSHTFYEATLGLCELGSEYRVVRFDFSGHGLSPLAEHLSIDSLADDLAQLCDALGVATARGIIAHSMSGLVANTFAARYPSRVEQLVLLGPMKAMATAGQDAMRQRASTVSEAGMSAIVGAVVKSATSAYTQAHSPLSLALIRALVLGTDPNSYEAACLALAAAVDPDYSRIAARVLVVTGAEDYLSTADVGEAIVAAIGPHASRVELERVGHWHAVEAPKAVADILTDLFLVEA